jgi:hypothetical protein
MKKATKLTEDRRRKIRARRKEVPDLDRWRSVIQRFARGWAGKQSWATLDFLIESERNFTKVEEGNYDEPTTRGTTSSNRPHEQGRYADVDRQAEMAGRDLLSDDIAAKENVR